MGRTPREAAACALMSVFDQGGFSNLVLDNILTKEDLPPEDRSFCAALFYTAVQRVITLDYAIGCYSRIPVKKLSPAVLACLRCGFCQLIFMSNIPQSAVVNETVKSVKSLEGEHAAGFVNGVLRSFIRSGLSYPCPKDKLTALSVTHSMPMPLIQLWRKTYGHQTTLDILEGLETAPPIFIRVNSCKTTPAQLIELLGESGATAAGIPGCENALVLESQGSVTRLEAFQQGLFHVQDLSSQQAAAAAAPLPGQRVLDVCSAPGGKSFTLAQMMDNRGELIACDLYPQRVQLIADGARRLGLDIVRPLLRDALTDDPALGEFDLVFCDVVCSGFGILRRKPEIRYKPLETLDGLPNIQYNILDMSSRRCRRGGRLVYSTCTLNRQENEQVVERFLGQHPDFAMSKEPVTIFPSQGGGDGFFYTVMEREQ